MFEENRKRSVEKVGEIASASSSGHHKAGNEAYIFHTLYQYPLSLGVKLLAKTGPRQLRRIRSPLCWHQAKGIVASGCI